MVKLEAFVYKSGKIPKGYRCVKCNAKNCKLWRQYQTMADQIELLCANCSEKDQGKKLKLEKGGSDQIGWLVPAIPTEDGETYWGYTSVPDDGCDWWDALPIRPGQKPPFDELSPYMRRRFERMARNKAFYKEALADLAIHAKSRLMRNLPVEGEALQRVELFLK